MASTQVDIQEALTRVSGLDPLQLNDLYIDAPEPCLPPFVGLRTVGANLLYLFERLPQATWNDPDNRLLEARAHRFIERIGRPEPGDYERSWPFKVTPHAFQLKIFAAARLMTAIALAPVVMGAGKSKIMLDVAADKFMRGEIDRMAIIAAPSGVPRQWVNKVLPEHMTDAVRWRAGQWKPTRKTDPKLVDYNNRFLKVLTFNVEAFSREGGKAAKQLEQFLKEGPALFLEDESSRIKTPGATRTKEILELAPLAKVRAITTGTPITKGMEDLWSQYQFLDPTIIGMSNYYAFRARYCVTTAAYRGAGLGAVRIVGYRNTEEFVRKIAGVTFVVPKDVLGLPPKSYEEVPVELTRDQKMAYNALRNKLVDDLSTMKIASPVNAAVRLIRLQQVLCGRVYEQPSNLEEPPFAKSVASNRISTLIETLQDAPGQQFVIWARFTDDIREISAALSKAGRSHATYFGATKEVAREKAVSDFASGRIQDIVGNPAALGMGVDGLQKAAERAIYYSSSFNREFRWQSEDRIHRLGMRGTALYLDMVAPNTVDRMILASYKKTEDLIAAIMSRPELITTLNDE